MHTYVNIDKIRSRHGATSLLVNLPTFLKAPDSILRGETKNGESEAKNMGLRGLGASQFFDALFRASIRKCCYDDYWNS